ncbi:MAG TPA: hypothetical protein VFU86_12500 [Terriglobales bacterium]|nr:hypothetical protein [Terriglobales bacterium]
MHLVGRFYRTIVEAIPLAVFLVDDELHVYRLNEAANRLSWLDPAVIFRQHGDEVLQCLRHADSPEGCGRGASCAHCVIRESTLECMARRKVHRRNLKFEVNRSDKKREMRVTVTVAPIPSEDGNVVLMVLEDMSEVTQLNDLIPICMHCKKIRDDQQDWQHVESYFHRCIGANFSHGICPECLRAHYEDTA